MFVLYIITCVGSYLWRINQSPPPPQTDTYRVSALIYRHSRALYYIARTFNAKAITSSHLTFEVKSSVGVFSKRCMCAVAMWCETKIANETAMMWFCVGFSEPTFRPSRLHATACCAYSTKYTITSKWFLFVNKKILNELNQPNDHGWRYNHIVSVWMINLWYCSAYIVIKACYLTKSSNVWHL